MPTTTAARRVAFATGLALGLAIGVPTGGWIADAHAQPQEDEPGWSCVDSGNRICGPDSDDAGHTPGCYDDGGVLVAAWPCHVIGDLTTGDTDVFTGPGPSNVFCADIIALTGCRVVA